MTLLLVMLGLAVLVECAVRLVHTGYRLQPPDPQTLTDAGLLDVEPAVRPEAYLIPTAGRAPRGITSRDPATTRPRHLRCGAGEKRTA